MSNRSIFSFLLMMAVISIFCLVQNNLAAQNNAFASVKERFAKHRQETLQEKIYVHTDKEFYLAGETVWFKLYYVDACFHQPLLLSKVAYVEVVDAAQKPVLQTKLSLSKEGSNGSLVLPADIGTGNYSLRAYTAWMKNFDADFYFEKKVTIVNTLSETNQKTPPTETETYDIQFFPEGGDLVSGLPTKLAFRAVDLYGKGVPLQGVVINAATDTVASFQTLVFGLGSFDFTPAQGNTYKAVVRLPGDQQKTVDLPMVHAQGYVLNLTENNSGTVEVNVQAAGRENTEVFLFAHARNQVFATDEGVVQNGKLSFNIAKEKLAEGISHFTLFDNRMQPVCERLFFKRPKKLQIEVRTDLPQYAPRQKVVLDVTTRNAANANIPAALSLAVYHVDSAAMNSGDIVSYLFLESDLKGNIESPGYYFTNESAESNRALDNLMLTHGWRRFKWDDIFQNKKPVFAFLPEIEGHMVTARVVHTATDRPAENIPGFLSIPGPGFHLYTGHSNKEGRIHFFAKNFYGPAELVAQPNMADKDSSYRIDIETPFSESYSLRKVPAFRTNEMATGGLQTKSVNMQVYNVYTAGKTSLSLPEKMDTAGFYGASRINYALDDYVRFPTMEEVLREYVREINVYRNNNGLTLALIRRLFNGIAEKKTPLVLIDGVPVLDDMNKIFRYDPLKVKDLRIVNKQYYLGTHVFEGIAHFKTYAGRPEGLELDKKATVLDYEGLQMKREFYHPVYETENQRQSRLPDFRTVLYWSPELRTHTDGKQSLSFYTSDLAGQYIGVMQGLTADGVAGSRTFTIAVKD